MMTDTLSATRTAFLSLPFAPGQPQCALIVELDGRRHIEYLEGSAFFFPPTDLGRVQSDRLDDYLYGQGGKGE